MHWHNMHSSAGVLCFAYCCHTLIGLAGNSVGFLCVNVKIRPKKHVAATAMRRESQASAAMFGACKLFDLCLYFGESW